MQERAPRRERVGEDELQLLRSGDEGDRSGSALHGSDQIVRIHLLGPRVGGQQPGDFALGLVHGHPAGQRVQCRVLGLRHHRVQHLQICLAGEQPDRRQEVRVDAEPGQVGVADVPEQPPAAGSRRVEGRLQSLDGFLVADFEHPDRPVDAEPVIGRVGVRLARGQDRDQAVRVAARLSQYDTAPGAVHANGAHPAVPAVLQLFQEHPGVRVPGKLGARRVDGALHVLLELCVFSQEAPRDRQTSHRLCPPVASFAQVGCLERC